MNFPHLFMTSSSGNEILNDINFHWNQISYQVTQGFFKKTIHQFLFLEQFLEKECFGQGKIKKF